MSTIATNDLLRTAKSAAQAGAEIDLRYFNSSLTYEIKDNDPIKLVSKADREAERAIMAVLKSAYPDHNFIGEEGTLSDQHSDYTWSIDPIDGTISYAAGLPFFCVSVGLLYKNQPYLAVVINPYGLFAPTEIFTAVSGQGAACNGQPIRVNGQQKLNEALIGWNYSPPIETAGIKLLLDNWQKFRYAISLPSAIYQLCLLARGHLAVFWQPSLEHWDITAASLIVTEAGGQATDIQGKPLAWSTWQPGQKFSFAASNGHLHDQLINALN